MSQSTIRRIAIIGGGLSGLATAVQLHLAQPNLQLRLFEASDRVGGVIDTERAGDFLLDRGPDMFRIKPHAALDLLKKIGAEDQLIRPQVEGRGARVVHDGKLVDVPEGFVMMRATHLKPMLTTPLLTWKGKLRFLVERWIPPIAGADDSDGLCAWHGSRRSLRLVGWLIRRVVDWLIS